MGRPPWIFIDLDRSLSSSTVLTHTKEHAPTRPRELDASKRKANDPLSKGRGAVLTYPDWLGRAPSTERIDGEAEEARTIRVIALDNAVGKERSTGEWERREAVPNILRPDQLSIPSGLSIEKAWVELDCI